MNNSAESEEHYQWLIEEALIPENDRTEKDEDGQVYSTSLIAEVMLRREAKARGDEAVLARLAEKDAAREKKRQSPFNRLAYDMLDSPVPAHGTFDSEREIRYWARPIQYPRALRKRAGQERCGRCGRWALRCKCSGKAADAMRRRERLRLDEIDTVEAKAKDRAVEAGTYDGKRKKRRGKNRRRYGPFGLDDLPEEDSHDYHALLLGLFEVDNRDEWRADWTLPDEVWERLEAAYRALPRAPRRPKRRPRWSWGKS